MSAHEISGNELHKLTNRKAVSLPGANHSRPFGPDYDVFKVGGKVFAMTTEVRGEKILTLKIDPERSKILREIFITLTPGYHMNKQHWISVAAGPGITRSFISGLICDAYDLVAKSLPAKDRPQWE
jgi:predicted DNA-binding protein (MmcQ/YjbR family)